jgi:hypothetical protein
MKQRAYGLIGTLAALGMALYGAPAFSARPPSMVSGSVTSIEGRQIVVNGVAYDVQLQGTALHQLGQVRVGQRVDLVLSGPPGAAATQVTGISVHNAH